MIAAGEMNKVFQLNFVTKADDGTGGKLEEFTETITVRGKLKLKSQDEDFNRGTDQLINHYEGWIYWRKDIEANITKDVHIIIEARRFKVNGYSLINEQRKMYKLKLEETR